MAKRCRSKVTTEFIGESSELSWRRFRCELKPQHNGDHLARHTGITLRGVLTPTYEINWDYGVTKLAAKGGE